MKKPKKRLSKNKKIHPITVYETAASFWSETFIAADTLAIIQSAAVIQTSKPETFG
ncbi:MAG: hypothetical protein LBU81_01090 [Methanosarcinales archaeon]|nr:hypothetical protein [Methanosarcinales archaeon]